MAFSAKEKAQRELERAQADYEKARDRHGVLADKLQKASEAAAVAQRQVLEAKDVLDHVAAHPALRQAPVSGLQMVRGGGAPIAMNA